MDNNITVVIPTHDRHHVLLRAIEYYRQINVQVIIADSSDMEFDGNLPDNVCYLHCPGFFMGDKIYKALCEVKTKYSCLSADDDFLSESGLSSGCDFLSNNADYVSVQGHFISFDPSNPEEKYYPLYSNMIGYENNAGSINDRLRKCFDFPQIYALHRTKDLKRCFEITQGISAVTVVEMCVPLVSLCIGKHKVLPIFWQARDRARYTKYLSVDGDNYRDDDDHLMSDDLFVVVTDWKSYLCTAEGMKFKRNFVVVVRPIVADGLQAEELFDTAFENYISNQNSNNDIVFNQNIRVALKKIMPAVLIKIIQKRNINRERSLLAGVGGYPFNDEIAMKDWNKMIKNIVAYRVSLGI